MWYRIGAEDLSVVSSLPLVPLVPSPLAGSGLEVWRIDDILAGAVH